MKTTSMLIFLQWAIAFFFALLVSVNSKPITAIKGTPYLFNTFSYSVDPNRGSQLAPAFQAANGALGANLVASYGTGINPNGR